MREDADGCVCVVDAVKHSGKSKAPELPFRLWEKRGLFELNELSFCGALAIYLDVSLQWWMEGVVFEELHQRVKAIDFTARYHPHIMFSHRVRRAQIKWREEKGERHGSIAFSITQLIGTARYTLQKPLHYERTIGPLKPAR